MFDDLLVFTAVIKAGSILAASKSLNQHPSQISRSIKKLEEHFNKQLLIRDARRMIATETGQLLFDYINEPLEHSQLAIENFNFAINDTNGSLNVVLPPIFAEYFVNPGLNQFLKKYPNLRLNLMFSFSDITQSIQHFDLAITTTIPRRNNYLIKTFMTNKPILCASPEYLQIHGVPASIDELLSQHLIIVPKIDDIEYVNWKFIPEDATTSIKSTERPINNFQISFNSNLAGKNLALSGSGIAPVLDFTVINELQSGKLIRILPDYHLPIVTFYLITTSKFKALPAELFLKFINRNINASKTVVNN